MDENEHTREVYARYGLTMYMAQCVEVGLVNLITYVYGGGPSQLTVQDVDRLFESLLKTTLGSLIYKLKKTTKVPSSLKKDLTYALKNRNWLAHQYFFDRAGHFMFEDGRNKMLQELDIIFQRLEKLNSVLDELIFKWAEQQGLSHDVIMKHGFEIIKQEDNLQVDVDEIVKSLERKDR